MTGAHTEVKEGITNKYFVEYYQYIARNKNYSNKINDDGFNKYLNNYT